MRTRFWKWMSCVGTVSLAFAVVPGALAQCGFPNKPVKPMSWQPQLGAKEPSLVRTAFGEDGQPSIVGMWHVVFTAQTMNGDPVNLLFDNSVVVWHSDGTEIMNSSRPAQDGNFCMGVWAQTGRLKYDLNHIPWQGNDPTGNPQGGAQLIEHVTLSPDGNHYSGTFTFTAYDTSGNPGPSYTGVFTAKRITPDTPFSDLL